MPVISPRRFATRVVLPWTALLLAWMLIFPGRDEQQGLVLRFFVGPGPAAPPPLPTAAARQSGSGPGGKAGSPIKMFWEETSPGKFSGEIYIPPEALKGNAAEAAPDDDETPVDEQAQDARPADPQSDPQRRGRKASRKVEAN